MSIVAANFIFYDKSPSINRATTAAAAVLQSPPGDHLAAARSYWNCFNDRPVSPCTMEWFTRARAAKIIGGGPKGSWPARGLNEKSAASGARLAQGTRILTWRRDARWTRLVAQIGQLCPRPLSPRPPCSRLGKVSPRAGWTFARSARRGCRSAGFIMTTRRRPRRRK